MSDKTSAMRSKDFRIAIEDIKKAYYEAEMRVEELEKENEKLRKIIEGDIRKMIGDLIEADIKETLKAFNTPKNQAAGKVIKEFIDNNQKGDNNEL